MPGAEITVVDIDEPLLEFIDGVAAERRLAIRTLFADLRDGLPDELHRRRAASCSPTRRTRPTASRLFLERALSALANRDRGRVVIAYGAGDHRPDLALAVQERMQRLRVVIEAIYPSFNRYVLAQAIGGWSDLYVCRPDRGHVEAARARGARRAASTRRARRPRSRRTRAVHSPAVDAAVALVPDGSVIDLRREPDELLLRVLLAADAPVAVIVRNNHADIVDERSQRALLDLVEPRVDGALPPEHARLVDRDRDRAARRLGATTRPRSRPPSPTSSGVRGGHRAGRMSVVPPCDDGRTSPDFPVDVFVAMGGPGVGGPSARRAVVWRAGRVRAGPVLG